MEKVVSIANMSPGIVRFYFDSKAAMLVASLQFLATEFEEQVLIPVAKLRSTPVAALQLMVDLYLDPDIASPRKVSVWYAFWGEASSRQEYYDICGKKDERFAELTRELIQSLIAETSRTHLDPDGVALGLIGVLEILWQDFAFQTERDIDRPAAKKRCMAYLRSVFPGEFEPAPPAIASNVRFAAWAYADARILAMERDAVFKNAWVLVGHESQLPRLGDFFTRDAGAERVLMVRDASGMLHALRNNCPGSLHTLVSSREGHLSEALECRPHGLQFALDGRRRGGAGGADLTVLDSMVVDGLIFVRSPAERVVDSAAPPARGFNGEPPQGLMLLDSPVEVEVAADWKVIVEQWLEEAPSDIVDALGSPSFGWHGAPVDHVGWSGAHYGRLTGCVPDTSWRRQFVAPNQLIETRPDGLSILQVLPLSAGRCLLHQEDYTLLPPEDSARAAQYLAKRISGFVREPTLTGAESIQRGMVDFGYAAAPDAPVSAALAWFRSRLAASIPALARERAPGG